MKKKICQTGEGKKKKNWTFPERFPLSPTLELNWLRLFVCLVWKISLTFIVMGTRVSRNTRVPTSRVWQLELPGEQREGEGTAGGGEGEEPGSASPRCP